jgi:hypothetical protein
MLYQSTHNSHAASSSGAAAIRSALGICCPWWQWQLDNNVSHLQEENFAKNILDQE